MNNGRMKTPNTDSPWSDLHWLTVLAEQGSYTAAALRLGVSKAAMSQRIALLERAAGVSLVLRTTRSLRLTDAGQRLVEETRKPFESIAHSFAGVRDLAAVPSGRLRVTAPVALARQQLVPRMAEFLRAQPEVRVELELSDRLSALNMEGLDLAIRHTAAPPDTHVAWALCRTRTVLVASRSYLRRRGTPRSPDDLQNHDCLYYPRAAHQPTWHFQPHALPHRKNQAPVSRTTVAVAGPFCANNSEALRDAAIAGLGIALLPDFSTQAALQGGKLVQVLSHWESVGAFGEHIYAIRPYAPQVPRAVSVFVDWLRQVFDGGFVLPPPVGKSAA